MNLLIFPLLLLFFNYTKQEYKKIHNDAKPISAFNYLDSDISILYSNKYEIFTTDTLIKIQKFSTLPNYPDKTKTSLITHSISGETCTLSSGEIINANLNEFEIINSQNESTKFSYSSGNTNEFPSLSCLNEKFLLLSLDTDQNIILQLYNKSGTLINSLTNFNKTYYNCADCVSINSNFVCLFIKHDNQNETHYIIFNDDLSKLKDDSNLIQKYD